MFMLCTSIHASTTNRVKSSSSMSILTKESLAEADVILNRTNIALARSRKLIQSWISDPVSDDTNFIPEEEGDLKAESETAGLGSTAHVDEKDNSVAASLRRSRAGDEKLLEQILGKKAAREHLKSRRAKASPLLSAPEKNAKVLAKSSGPQISDDEEDGRTTAVGRSRHHLKQNIKMDTGPADDDDDVDNSNDGHSPEGGASISTATAEPVSQSVVRISSKRKTSSYLDELLLQRSSKKKKIKPGKG